MNPRYQKKVAIGLVVLSVLALLSATFYGFHLNLLIAKPKDKFTRFFDEDIKLLKKTSKLPKEWDNLRTLQIRSAGSIGQQLINGWKPNILTKEAGKYKLDIFITDAVDISTRQYAAVIEFTFTDLTAGNNTVGQFGRTLSLGYIL